VSWVKEANKLGEYRTTYKGFRIYCTLKPEAKSRIEKRNLQTFRVTEFTKGKYVAIDKSGATLEGDSVDGLGYAIDIASLQQYWARKDARAR
jgi:hypothetical protein